MLTAYRELFTTPGSLRFQLAGIVARLPISTVSLGIVLLVSGTSGQYALAGAVSSFYMLTAAAVSVVIGRIADLRGQHAVLFPAAAITGLGMTSLITAAFVDAPEWTLFAAAALVGCGMPSAGSMTRARWANLYPSGSPQLQTAYSLEAVADELIFIGGPIMVTALAAWNIYAALLAVTVISVTGIAWLGSQRASQPTPHRAGQARGGSPLRRPAVLVLVLAVFVLGVVFGANEVVTIAFADHQGHRALVGLVLAVWALGSALAGLTYGVLRPTMPMHRQVLIGVAGLTLTLACLLIPGGLPLKTVVLFANGLFLGPAVIVTMSLIQAAAPAGRLTECMTLASTSIYIGATAGVACAGWAVDLLGAQTAYLMPVLAGVVATVALAAGGRWLRPLSVSTDQDADPAGPPARTEPAAAGQR